MNFIICWTHQTSNYRIRNINYFNTQKVGRLGCRLQCFRFSIYLINYLSVGLLQNSFCLVLSLFSSLIWMSDASECRWCSPECDYLCNRIDKLLLSEFVTAPTAKANSEMRTQAKTVTWWVFRQFSSQSLAGVTSSLKFERKSYLLLIPCFYKMTSQPYSTTHTPPSEWYIH